MYAFLLILGAVITAAGVLIAAPGLPILGHEFDASIITPGAVAIVGGLILVGLGLAVRVLSRIEQALAARPLPRSAIPEEAASVASAVAAEPRSAPPARIPFPSKPEIRPQPAPAAAVAPPALPSLAEDAAPERMRELLPTMARLENAPVVEETDISLFPKPPVRADEDIAEGSNGVVPEHGKANGVAPARIEPRLELHVRPTAPPPPPPSPTRAERPRNFDAYWPKKQRTARGAPAAPAIQPASPAVPPPPPPLAVEPALPAEPTQFQFREPAPEPHAETMSDSPAPVSVLKSGVVDGMAYTLYSDGSIEAQLPQGTLRFGSITELRNHIEQSA
jgi:hypothetical protein